MSQADRLPSPIEVPGTGVFEQHDAPILQDVRPKIARGRCAMLLWVVLTGIGYSALFYFGQGLLVR